MNFDEYYNNATNLANAAIRSNLSTLANGLRGNISALKTALTNSQQNPQITQSARNQIDPQKNALISAMEQTIDELDKKGQFNEFLDSLIGVAVQAEISSIQPNVNINNTSLLENIETSLGIIQLVINFSTAANTAKTAFSIETSAVINEDSLTLTFENNSSSTGLMQLSNASKNWNTVIMGFARLVDTNDTRSDIVSIKKGSIILTLIADPKVIIALASCAVYGMKVKIQSLKVKEQQLKIKELNSPGMLKVLAILEHDAKINVNKESIKIVEELIKRYLPQNKAETSQEVTAFLLKSVKKVLIFLINGGSLQANLINPSLTEREESRHLIEANKEAVNIEHSLEPLGEGKRILLLDEKDSDDIAVDTTDEAEGDEDDEE